jgi:hypothetical protein
LAVGLAWEWLVDVAVLVAVETAVLESCVSMPRNTRVAYGSPWTPDTYKMSQ